MSDIIFQKSFKISWKEKMTQKYINPAAKVLANAKRTKSKIDLTSKCLGCGETYTHKIPWFEKNKYKCPKCGGQIDYEPVKALLLESAKKLLEVLG